MTEEEAKEAFEQLRKEGASDDDIIASLGRMYETDQITKAQLGALVELLGYTLKEDFAKMSDEEAKKNLWEETPEEEADEAISPEEEAGDFIEPIPGEGEISEEHISRNALMEQVMERQNVLSPREAKVLELRLGLGGNHPHTLAEIGYEFGLTREGVRQIEKKAILKLRQSPKIKELGFDLDAAFGSKSSSVAGRNRFKGPKGTVAQNEDGERKPMPKYPQKGTEAYVHFRAYQAEYKKKTYKSVPLMFHIEKDKDLLEALKTVPNRNVYIKEVLRKALGLEK